VTAYFFRIVADDLVLVPCAEIKNGDSIMVVVRDTEEATVSPRAVRTATFNYVHAGKSEQYYVSRILSTTTKRAACGGSQARSATCER
jgi:hypothetical protein